MFNPSKSIHSPALVSVIIPTHNQDRFLSKCIQSVVGQSYKNLEIVVVDDVSTDSTPKIIADWQKKDSRIRSIRNPHNLGATGSRNQGIKKSHGEYIAFLDSDDFWDKDKIEQQLQLFRHPHVGLVYCSSNSINSQGKVIGGNKAQWRGDVFLKLIYAMRIIGSNSSVMVKRRVIDKIGYFNPKLPYTGDWDLWLRISSRYHFDFVAKPMTNIRQHPHSMGKNIEKFIVNHLQFFVRAPLTIVRHPKLTGTQKLGCLKIICQHFINNLTQLIRLYYHRTASKLALWLG